MLQTMIVNIYIVRPTREIVKFYNKNNMQFEWVITEKGCGCLKLQYIHEKICTCLYSSFLKALAVLMVRKRKLFTNIFLSQLVITIYICPLVM